MSLNHHETRMKCMNHIRIKYEAGTNPIESDTNPNTIPDTNPAQNLVAPNANPNTNPTTIPNTNRTRIGHEPDTNPNMRLIPNFIQQTLRWSLRQKPENYFFIVRISH